eukprot:CAMPEP_0181176212 /NCGR_PEP_ID=MMETSP1096-20121128/4506_1 /TAXON_ID=156174 ORGANISM="Chrysochromulina ericina, Strain CCMP281" /NCGR_SAMPLE_ID=MMETSP1096 /ASSEMBLY_ACC=CAM_ASM_000453 /LENGTH=55 /DNA_ID=CAMNT_0023264279 /DNA_START=426 /DNA_END=594 /DNA_ORIENTATION=+
MTDVLASGEVSTASREGETSGEETASRLKAGAPEQTQYREHDSYRAQTVEGTIMS